jgi:hypothetical protein
MLIKQILFYTWSLIYFTCPMLLDSYIVWIFYLANIFTASSSANLYISYYLLRHIIVSRVAFWGLVNCMVSLPHPPLQKKLHPHSALWMGGWNYLGIQFFFVLPLSVCFVSRVLCEARELNAFTVVSFSGGGDVARAGSPSARHSLWKFLCSGRHQHTRRQSPRYLHLLL